MEEWGDESGKEGRGFRARGEQVSLGASELTPPLSWEKPGRLSSNSHLSSVQDNLNSATGKQNTIPVRECSQAESRFLKKRADVYVVVYLQDAYCPSSASLSMCINYSPIER